MPPPDVCRRLRLALLAFVLTATVARADDWATPDSTAALSDSTAALSDSSAIPADSTARTSAAASSVRLAPGDLNLDGIRRDGRTSARLQLQERGAIQVLELPLPGEGWDRLSTSDAGVPLPGGRTHATDRTPVSGFPLNFGLPNAATAIGSPGLSRSDPFLVSGWRAAPTRNLMEGAAELLAMPRVSLWWEPALLERGATLGATESALLYEKGDDGLQQVGARFVMPSLGPGLAAAYTRRATDGAEAWWRATDRRYAAAVLLPRQGALRGWIEGDLASRRIEDAAPDPDPLVVRTRAGESMLEDRSLALHLRRGAGAWEHRLRAEVARTKHTGIEIDGVRRRWDEPSWTIGGESRWSPAAEWLWIGAIHAAGRDLRYRAGPALTPIGPLDTSFRETWREGRVGLAVRRDVARHGTTRAWGADIAYDARENDRGMLDARLHASLLSRRGSARVDLESAHDRATAEDLLLPERDRVSEDLTVLPKPVRYTESGDPTLRPRRLNGAVASAQWRPAGRMELTASGSARYIVDDFGWELSRIETADSIFVEDRATRRGSGWTSHASLGAAASWRSLSLRALGWMRGGSSRLSPRGGALPTAGLDASLDGGVILFRGDL
ncbi:MAG: hypothetical protein AAB011_11680, partial [Candidatus Eisenbacteria bacterium]